MVLESTMICFDNSEDMRNGDFTPTRLQAQQDGANLLIQCKLRSNPENAVGLLSMADRVNVLTTLTTDNNKLFIKLHQIQPDGAAKFLIAIKIAHLALKHRQNRNHKPRVILFVGSLLEEDEGELIKTAKKFKKEKVNVDIVCFGDEANTNYEKLKSFLETINGKDGTGSHMIAVPPGSDLQQALMTSPIVRSEDGTAPPVVAAHGQGFFDVDPNEDPELALALRVSLEEQRARQQQEESAAAAASAAEQQPAGGTGPAAAAGRQQPAMPANFDSLSEEEQIALALQISLEQEQGAAAAGGASGGGEERAVAVEPMDTGEPSKSVDLAAETDEAQASDDIGELMADPSALQALVSTLPGVDPNSEVVQQAMAQAAAASSSKDKPAQKKAATDGKPKEKKKETGQEKEDKK